MTIPFGSDDGAQSWTVVGHHMASSIVCLESWITTQRRTEWIWCITEVQFNTWHNDRELRFIGDAIALQEIASVVLDATQVETANVWTDANRIFNEQGRTTTHLCDQRSLASSRCSVDRSDDRVANLFRGERGVLNEWHCNRSSRYPELAERWCIVGVDQETSIVAETQSIRSDIGVEFQRR